MSIDTEKYSFEIKWDDYPFLNVQEPQYKNQHYEVTDFSISIIRNCYRTKKNTKLFYENYIFHESTLHRRQMSTAGAYLESRCKGGRGTDVVADILTSERIVKKLAKNRELFNKYKKVHHTIGNIMPVPEGANAGMLGNDIYYDKLLFIKKNIESIFMGKFC
ncbi:MAG: hypothetical protein IJ873_02225 [Lachnospiraceae bacterium]|nr:hypothetical protein [Lachnospiraceae bacterium]